MNQNQTLRPIKRMVKEIAEMAEHASLTGSLRGGEAQTARRYNGILTTLQGLSVLPPDLFLPLAEQEATFSSIGVDARLLYAFLKGREEDVEHEAGDEPFQHGGILMRLAPFVDSQDLADLIRTEFRKGIKMDMDQLAGLAPFLSRESLRDILSDLRSPQPPAPPEPPRPAAAPHPHPAPEPPRPPQPPRPPMEGYGVHPDHEQGRPVIYEGVVEEYREDR